ncbi:MAG: major capsid protein [Pseudomonadales bacterium]
MAEENEIDLENPAVKAAIATAVEASVSGLKTKNSELLGKLKETTGKLTQFETQFEGIDIDAVKGLLSRAGQDEETKLLTEGKVDEVFTANIETDGKKTLTRGMRKFGDKFGRIALWVMHSSAYFDIVDEAITNKIYEEAGVVIYGGLPGTLGKPVLVTDTAPADVIFGLLPNAVVITESQAPGFRSYPVNDEENLGIGYRAEGTVNIDVLGYSWKESAGGANPTLAAVGSAANWAKHADSNKVTAGVMITLTPTPPAGG